MAMLGVGLLFGCNEHPLEDDGGLFRVGPGLVQSNHCADVPADLEFCTELDQGRPYLAGRDYLTDPNDPTAGFDASALAEDFRCIASAGDCGGVYERGLGTLGLSLRDDLRAANSSFLREEAFLVVVFLADEDDCTEIDGVSVEDCIDARSRDRLEPAEHFYNELVTLNGGDESRVLIAGLIGPPGDPANPSLPSCVQTLAGGAVASALDGARYREIIQLARPRGLEESICQADFSGALFNIGRVLRENLDVHCVPEAPLSCTSDADCDGGATCTDVGSVAFCSNFEIAVEIQAPDGGDFHLLASPGSLGGDVNPNAEFEVDFDAESCLSGVSFRFTEGSRPSPGSRYRVTYPR